MGRIGLFGGTFDPPHVGHLILASVISDALALDEVWFVPAADPPHKQGVVISHADHRLAMVRLATHGDRRFQVSLIDVSRPGPHFSVDMVALAQAARPDSDFFFLMGSDTLRELPHWFRPHELLAHCTLAILKRPEYPVVLDEMEARLSGIKQRSQMVDGPGITVAASMIRERVAQGLSIRYLVLDSVADYIDAQGLYR